MLGEASMEEPARAIWTTRMSLWRWAAVVLALVIVVLRRDLQAGPVVALAAYIVLTALSLRRYRAWSNSPLVAVLDIAVPIPWVLTRG